MKLSENFPRRTAPGSGRKVVQLTSGEGFCYPLYYFIPSITAEGRYLIHHRAENGMVQLHRLDLQTAKSVQLTNANWPDTHWYPWDTDAGSGVVDHRSVLNRVHNEVIYFTGPEARVIDLDSLEDKFLFDLPPGRTAIGQNCVTPDGQWFIYIHADQANYEQIFKQTGKVFPGERWRSKRTALCAFHRTSGEHRTLVWINSPIHHVIAYDNNHVIFCHPAMENGMLWTDLKGGWYTHLRTQDGEGGSVCHYVVTAKGIAYEVLKENYTGHTVGRYDPHTHWSYELSLPAHFGYTHTACDEEGRLWIFENQSAETHDLHFLAEHHPAGDRWQQLFSHWPTYGSGQKSHFHPRLTPDRQWLILTAGDAETKSNHIYLLDVSDLTDTRGIPEVPGCDQ